jgi:hypothetical protein
VEKHEQEQENRNNALGGGYYETNEKQTRNDAVEMRGNGTLTKKLKREKRIRRETNTTIVGEWG